MSNGPRTGRTLALVVASVLAVLSVGCSPSPVVLTFRPATQAPRTPAGGSGTGDFDGTTAQSIPCEKVTAATAEAQPYLAAAPDRPAVPGVGQPGEEELNEGRDPVTPFHPDAVIEADADLETPVIVPPGAEGDPEPEDVVTFRQPTSLPGAGQVAEPNIAVAGSTTLMTWNWGAARSFDGGATVSYMDPSKAMLGPDGRPVDGGFCCDQLAHYVPELDLWLWVLQSLTTNRDSSGGNRIRVFVAHGDAAFTQYLDFPSASSGLPGDVWFDQPKIGTSNGHMFLSVNAYEPEAAGKDFVASVVYRVALSDVDSGVSSGTDCVSTLDVTTRSGFPVFAPVPVRRAGSTMYLGAHYTNSELVIWRWPDADAQPTLHLVLDVNEQGQPAGYPVPVRRTAEGSLVTDYSCPRAGGATASSNWCQRSNDRISSAWMSAGQIGFAWSVGQDPANGWPYPSVFVRLIDEASVTACAQGGCIRARPNLRHSDTAYQYAAIGANDRGDLGMVALYGGGTYKPSCHYFIRSREAGPTAGWDWSKGSFISDIDTLEAEYGHYLNIWPGPSPGSWTAACMTLHVPAQNQAATVRFFEFGRRVDQPTP